MSMSFDDVNTMGGGGGGMLAGLLAGSTLNRRDDDRGNYIWAVIIFAIIFIIALVFLAAFMRRDERREVPGTDVAALLTPLIAAKSIDCGKNGCNYDHDEHAEIKNQIAHSEDRRMISDTQKEIAHQGQAFMQLGFGLSGQIHNNDKVNLEQFGEIKQKMGMLELGVGQLLQKSNNEDIIQGVINRLVGGYPAACAAR